MLLVDLRRLHTLAAGVSLDWVALAQGAQAARDFDLLATVTSGHGHTLRTLKWTTYRPKEAAPQILTARDVRMLTPERALSGALDRDRSVVIRMWTADNTRDAERQVVRVLEADPDLAVDLDPGALSLAVADLTAPSLPLDWVTKRARWGPRNPRGHLGLLILDGLLLREVRVLGTGSAEVLGEGDLLRPWDTDGEYVLPVPAEVHWTRLAPCRVAILNPRFLSRAARWPDVLARLTGRTVGRAKSLALHDAITNLKHVETRLLVQFWHLAERWGRADTSGISVSVPLTHAMLAKLVGATRPSVTTALGRLATDGLLVRESRESWRLHHDSRAALAPLPLQPDTRLPA